MADIAVRPARAADHDAVAAIAERTWTDREREDYIDRVFERWLDADEPHRTVVAEVEGTVAGLARSVMLTDHEAWMQGLRVDPDHRGLGLSDSLRTDLFDWARDQGAVVGRNMVFSWNDAGLGQSLSSGFDPRCACRHAHPEPMPAAEQDGDPFARVTENPAAAWTYCTRSEARDALAGLFLDPGVPWTLSTLTRDRLLALAEDNGVLTVVEDGARAFALRTARREVTTDDGPATVAEYGAAAWADGDALAGLLPAVRADAAAAGADHSRLCVPETPRHVAEAARARGDLSDGPLFVFEADLARR